MAVALASRKFELAGEERFARISGDANPMHLDALAARRTQAGAPVVHGVHAVLWACEALASAGRFSRDPVWLKVEFRKFIYVGSEATLHVLRESPDALRIELQTEGLTALVCDVGFSGAFEIQKLSGGPEIVVGEKPAVMSIDELHGFAGSLCEINDRDVLVEFPELARNIGAGRVAALMRLSTLVGMVCPGLHSIFSALAVSLTSEAEPKDLSFEVTSVDQRVRLVEMTVSGAGIVGTVAAFLRQPPVAQASFETVKSYVDPHEFENVSALIVGGSRGLGAFAARAIVAGGGTAIVTFAVGEAEAAALSSELGTERCRAMRYDALVDAASQIVRLPRPVNALYYFATSQIFRQKPPGFQSARFREFCKIYVDGFEDLCSTLLKVGNSELHVFYPSSTAVTDHPRDMTEYSMAKVAGEMLCADMNRFGRGIQVLCKRLPRLLTDQTATVMPVETQNTLDVMLPILREMSAGRVT